MGRVLKRAEQRAEVRRQRADFVCRVLELCASLDEIVVEFGVARFRSSARRRGLEPSFPRKVIQGHVLAVLDHVRQAARILQSRRDASGHPAPQQRLQQSLLVRRKHGGDDVARVVAVGGRGVRRDASPSHLIGVATVVAHCEVGRGVVQLRRGFGHSIRLGRELRELDNRRPELCNFIFEIPSVLVLLRLGHAHLLKKRLLQAPPPRRGPNLGPRGIGPRRIVVVRRGVFLVLAAQREAL
mmetsp:Transcript_19380/g.65461  ORF Transcript_19380/g.65461 Transcript_19380/m.65461 type:complete len:241 (+) Transcript_19380:1055-1777(+)